ncbi:Xaa-Pro aminopeptidase 1 [Porphyridium purpureum]|uniref:Xaa-Pro aminopeptidase 1 n=1 Tax=Porphyridium purpureum TaxID=35688 RepID=A0A5J4YX74_PORPP|nr:Xaa-Pro aminopeptidase 1 [Porphyridium purpureum]|eukprot:POR4925..scf209_3
MDAAGLALVQNELLTEHGLDALIIPHGDAHASEYTAPCFERLHFASGFSGSAGTGLITREAALLWTDARYFLQATQQLRAPWKLMRMPFRAAAEPQAALKSETKPKGVSADADSEAREADMTMQEYIATALPADAKVGVDGWLYTERQAKQLIDANVCLVPLSGPNLVDVVWERFSGKHCARPDTPCHAVRLHELQWSGAPSEHKLALIREHIRTQSTERSSLLVSALDEVAWVLNIRGEDVPHTPVALAYLWIRPHDCVLYIHANATASQSVRDYLDSLNVRVAAYDSRALLEDISGVAPATVSAPARIPAADALVASPECLDPRTGTGMASTSSGPMCTCSQKVWMDPDTTSMLLTQTSASSLHQSPIPMMKAVKNRAELNGLRSAHVKDAVAMVRLLHWLEHGALQGVFPTECDIAEKALEFRAQQPGFLDISFGTICAVGANAAIIHYQPERGEALYCSNARTSAEELVLIDSGGQYLEGTTDVTRTIQLGGAASRHVRECFTRVLQGHIQMETLVFPAGTLGAVLDASARAQLWRAGLDYRHGTGHGVGAALCVHEGPQTISSRVGTAPVGIVEGMCVSNEPGYYEEGKFGVRIESVVVAVRANTAHQFGSTPYITFENITHVPIQQSLLELSLMSQSELDWLNDYHMRIWHKLRHAWPWTDDELRWLEDATRAISKSDASTGTGKADEQEASTTRAKRARVNP